MKDVILEEYKNGNIVFNTPFGPSKVNLKEFIEQPADGILYDLNRGEETVLVFIDDPKWINDYAVAKTIRALKERIEELTNNK